MPGEPFRRRGEAPILTARDFPWPVNAVFNAAAALVGGETWLLLRIEDRCGRSHLVRARSRDGERDWRLDAAPLFSPHPSRPEEAWGIEDPRLTRLEEEGLWALTYTAYSDRGPLVELATSRDLVAFERLGPVLPPDNKDAALFPRRFGGRWAMLHRPSPPGFPPGIWIAYSPDLVHWGGHRRIMRARGPGWWDAHRIGAGPPPLPTPEGWLLLYHGVRRITRQEVYRLGLALLDSEDPGRVLRRADAWVLAPERTYERSGDVNNVVFPCGWVLDGGELRLYYGCADTSLALATASLDEVLDWLRRHAGGAEGGEA